MASFGDNSTVFQRAASLGTGLRIETGEWTSGSTTDVSIPSTFTRVISLILNSGDGSVFLTEIPEMSASFITGNVTNTTSNKIVSYVAFGW